VINRAAEVERIPVHRSKRRREVRFIVGELREKAGRCQPFKVLADHDVLEYCCRAPRKAAPFPRVS